MILRKLPQPADTGDVDYARRVVRPIFATFCQQPKEGHRHEEYR